MGRGFWFLAGTKNMSDLFVLIGIMIMRYLLGKMDINLWM